MSPEINFRNCYRKSLENESSSQLNSSGIASGRDPVCRPWSVGWEDGNDRVAPVHEIKRVEEVKSQIQILDFTKANITAQRNVIRNKTRPNDDARSGVSKF